MQYFELNSNLSWGSSRYVQVITWGSGPSSKGTLAWDATLAIGKVTKLGIHDRA